MTSHQDTAGQRGHLLRGIGFIGAAILVVNSVIGAGIFAMPAAVSARAGALSPWLFLLVGLLILTVVLTFAELASYFKDSGGPVLYTSAAFGPLLGFTAGWILIISRVTAFAANSNIMSMYLGELWPWFREGIGRSLLLIAVCSLLTLVNCLGVKDGVRAMAVLTFYAIPAVALVLTLWTGAQSGWLSWIVTGALLLVGLILYRVAAQRRTAWTQASTRPEAECPNRQI